MCHSVAWMLLELDSFTILNLIVECMVSNLNTDDALVWKLLYRKMAEDWTFYQNICYLLAWKIMYLGQKTTPSFNVLLFYFQSVRVCIYWIEFKSLLSPSINYNWIMCMHLSVSLFISIEKNFSPFYHYL